MCTRGTIPEIGRCVGILPPIDVTLQDFMTRRQSSVYAVMADDDR
jgi:hypothetical protein